MSRECFHPLAQSPSSSFWCHSFSKNKPICCSSGKACRVEINLILGSYKNTGESGVVDKVGVCVETYYIQIWVSRWPLWEVFTTIPEHEGTMSPRQRSLPIPSYLLLSYPAQPWSSSESHYLEGPYQTQSLDFGPLEQRAE